MKQYTVGNTGIYACGVGGCDDVEAGIQKECHMQTQRICSNCGKPFHENDTHFNAHYTKKLGYGSEYDGELITVDLCIDCADYFINLARKTFYIDPITGEKNEGMNEQ